MNLSLLQGGISDPKGNDVPLPNYVRIRPEGVFIIPSRIPPGDGITPFVDRLFSSGSCFKGLVYSCFMELLYDTCKESQPKGSDAEIRIAESIARFPPQRSALYKDPKIINGGALAEYLFEPVMMEVIVDEPVYSKPADDGTISITDYTRKSSMQPTQLDFDEFAAAMWLKNVRFGIDEKTVRDTILNGKTGRMTIATQHDPANGTDAEIHEASDVLHRDNSPAITLSGKADLRRFKNRFPQITKDKPLLQKIPRKLGKPGYLVTGEVIEPPLPADIDLNELAGAGTRIESTGKGEFIISAMDGFVVFDTRSNHIEVTLKVENRGGISIRTTGDLSLNVDDYVEHGEVQEGRVIEGKHMTFLSDVFGTVISENGNILLKSNLSGGRLQSNFGNIAIEGRAYNASLESRDGKINLMVAENCTIFGKIVSIEHAVNCEIVAGDLYIDVAEGCAIAGKNVRLTSSDMRKDQETVITMLAPNFSGFDQKIAQLRSEMGESRKATQAKTEEIRKVSSQPEFAKYLAAANSIKMGTIKLTEAQQAGWQQMVTRFARQAKMLSELEAERNKLAENSLALEQEIARISHLREESAQGVQCEIGEVLGETIVLKQPSGQGLDAYYNLPNRVLKTRLRQLDEKQERIFSSDEGSVKWRCKAPKPPID